MKGLEFDLNNIFKIEGFLTFLLLVPVTMLIYFGILFSPISAKFEDDITELFRSKLDYSSANGTDTNSRTCDLDPNASNKPQSLNLILRVPKTITSFVEAPFELVVENTFLINQKVSFFIDDEFYKLDDKTDGKLTIFTINGIQTNRAELDIPPCSRQIIEMTIKPPRNTDDHHSIIRLGVMKSAEASYGKDPFIVWDNNLTCESVSQKYLNSKDYICIPINAAQTFEASVHEQLLLSPWTNVFIPALVFIVVFIADHVIPQRYHFRKHWPTLNTVRFWKVFVISFAVIMTILLMIYLFGSFNALLCFVIVFVIIIFFHTFHDSAYLQEKFPSIYRFLLKRVFIDKGFDTENTLHKSVDELSKSIAGIVAADGIIDESFNELMQKIDSVIMACNSCEKQFGQEYPANAAYEKYIRDEIDRANQAIVLHLLNLLILLNYPQQCQILSKLFILDPDNELYLGMLIELLPQRDGG